MNLYLKWKLTQSQTMVTKGEGAGDKLGVWDIHIHTITYKIDKQQGFIVQHRELYSISYNNL